MSFAPTRSLPNEVNEPLPTLQSEESGEATYVHPDARALFNKVPCLRRLPMFGTAAEGYGPKAVMSISLSYFLCKGLSDYLVRDSLLAMFTQRFGVDVSVYQRLSNVANMGWSVKPLTAVVSDIFPLFGYSKRWYMFISCLIGPLLSLGFGLLPGKESSAAIGAALVFLCCFTKANVDILAEGHYSRMMRRVPAPGPALVSWIWWFIIAGSFVSSSVVGPLGDAKIPQVASFIASVVQILVLPFFIFNWFGELPNREERYGDALLLYKKKREEREKKCDPFSDSLTQPDRAINSESNPLSTEGPDAAGLVPYEGGAPTGDGDLSSFHFQEPGSCCCGVFEYNKEVVERNGRATVYSILIGLFVLVVAVTSVLGSTTYLTVVAIVVSLLHCSFNFYAFPLIIAKANLFGYLQRATSVSFPGALSNFFIAEADCLADGPHFSFAFYQTVGGIISCAASIVGIMLFNYIFSKRTYRMTYLSTLSLGIFSSIFDLVLVMRWNRPHVSDHALYIMGDAIISPVISMLNWMPQIVLLSRLCPRGSESTVYSILAASSNLGASMGSVVGSVVMEYALPVSSKLPCNFENLKWLVVIAGFLAPLLQIPMVFTLLPRARMCDDLDVDNATTKKKSEIQKEVAEVQESGST
ncbi:pteridine transporter, putative [Trypanosoma brucei gambiense DAL972]|uniref:Pteridine transporter, putative n=1 Tax=Trypanosoma brucei gambiense (strain MHOM/CI/86/DAL972) TaxID=679716 RepID=D0A423_TRYB9|nr:pteridine transporter, putative [Trypanosoma brucei gambiense DAL972]CBH16017.1 pteridine transporter, putative [Trypanosoma brucei gambiense DAL972]|eukprot:XP_011778281.1 pteridine transporter, putative [Trypanosoma brucei gambiense DAL972]